MSHGERHRRVDGSLAELLGSAFLVLAGVLDEHEKAACDTQAEPIHQMRIAVRRVRALLRVFRTELADEGEKLDRELRWLAGKLGAVRELSILTSQLKLVDSKDLPAPALNILIETLDERQNAAQRALGAALTGRRYAALKLRLCEKEFAASSPSANELDPIKLLRKDVIRQWKRLQRKAEKLSVSSDSSEYHQVRKAQKRLRYATEVVVRHSTGTERQTAEVLTRSLKRLQDALGVVQDTSVLLQTLRQLSRTAKLKKIDFSQLLTYEELQEKRGRKKFLKRWKEIHKLKL